MNGPYNEEPLQADNLLSEAAICDRIRSGTDVAFPRNLKDWKHDGLFLRFRSFPFLCLSSLGPFHFSAFLLWVGKNPSSAANEGIA